MSGAGYRDEWHGVIAATPPSSQAVSARIMPKAFAGPDEWSRWRCFRGIVCCGDNQRVLIGMAASPSPLDEAVALSFEFAEFDIASAEQLHLRLGLAIELAKSKSA